MSCAAKRGRERQFLSFSLSFLTIYISPEWLPNLGAPFRFCLASKVSSLISLRRRMRNEEQDLDLAPLVRRMEKPGICQPAWARLPEPIQRRMNWSSSARLPIWRMLSSSTWTQSRHQRRFGCRRLLLVRLLIGDFQPDLPKVGRTERAPWLVCEAHSPPMKPTELTKDLIRANEGALPFQQSNYLASF